jgi:hypothetical protein
MAKPRVTATDRLSNVIDVVEMGRRTGLLSVERGSGSVLEVGEMYFVNGNPTYASLAGLRGREALNALSHWGPCRFAFDSEDIPPAPNIFPSTDPSLQRAPRDRYPSSPRMPSSDPATTGQAQTGSLRGTWALQANAGAESQDGATSSRRDGHTPTRPPGPSPTGPLNRYSTPGSSVPSYLPPNAPSPRQRPRRAPDVRDLMSVVTAHNLSRSHRTVLLLADGEHTILDLARLSSKSVDEITWLLADLESRGLVYYYGE